MGVLRLLYCDSAGVRRCRAVVYKGVLPAAADDGTSNAHASAAHTLAAAAGEPELCTTPSMLEAAAAGIISLHPSSPEPHTNLEPEQQEQEQQDLTANVAAIAIEDAGPFAQNAAALAASSGDSFATCRSNSQAALTTSQSNGNLLSQASSTRLLQPLTRSQIQAMKVAVPYATGLTKGSMGQTAAADMVLTDSGLCAVGEVLLVPDLAAVQQLPWAKGHSVAPVDMMERDLSKPYTCCPRSALKQALAALEIAHNIKLQVGFELEFMLLRPISPGPPAVGISSSGLVLQNGCCSYVPLDTSIYCQSTSFDQAAPVLDKMVEALESMGIGVLQYHAESAPGQFEIATTHFPALEAADKLLLTKETISAVAHQAGLEVTFLPKPLADYAGSGCHCHISLWKAQGGSSDGSSSSECLMTAGTTSSSSSGGTPQGASVPLVHGVPGYPNLSAIAEAFVAGLLKHLAALLPFTAASFNSYARLKPGTWSGAVACWGWDNREAPLRLCCPAATNPDSCNIEFKPFDGTANPYIGLVAIIAAGMRGLQDGEVLPAPQQADPAAAAAAIATADKLQELPGSLSSALDALQKDSSLQVKLQQLLGPELLKAYLAVKTYEAQDLSADSVSALLLRY